jgi:hypothetical protein
MWDAIGILGFDLDGQPTPAATLISGEQSFREYFIRCIREAREDYDAAVDQVCEDPLVHPGGWARLDGA